ncbi:MAG: LuxR C-terminal-related transcriptional regulator [Miltoncostaeaceae bacterium]
MTTEQATPGATPPLTRSGARVAMLRASVRGLAVPSALVAHVSRVAARGSTRGVPADVADLVLRSPEAVARALTALSAREDGVTPAPRRDLRHALDDLGLDALRGALEAGPTYSVLHPRPGPRGLSVLAFAARAAEVACLAGDLVPHMPAGSHAHIEPARAAGLLHDLGAALLVEPRSGLRLLPGAPTSSDHAAVGAALCRMWRLAPEVVDAVRHHSALTPPEGPVGRAVWIATRVEAARAGELDASLAAAAGACGLDPARLADALIGDLGVASGDALEELTPREHEILVRLAAGEVPKQIAAALGCSASTVNNHLHHVYGKLEVSGQAHALLVARERGWV